MRPFKKGIRPAYLEIDGGAFIRYERAIRDRVMRPEVERHLVGSDRRDFRRDCEIFDRPGGALFFEVPDLD